MKSNKLGTQSANYLAQSADWGPTGPLSRPTAPPSRATEALSDDDDDDDDDDGDDDDDTAEVSAKATA